MSDKITEIFMGLMNLHDAFLNASLQRKHMQNSAIENDAEKFLISDRGRFERTWVTFLYVLIEAWQARETAEVRKFISSLTSTDKLESMLRKANKDGTLTKMTSVRHYMCHRDKRKYWDDGRLGSVGRLIFNEEIHMEFSRIFLDAFKKRKRNLTL